MRNILLVSIALSIASLGGCGGSPGGAPAGNLKAEIQAAVDAHLAKRTDLALGDMDVAVDSVDLQGDDKAEAVVSFRAPGAAEAAMSMTYQLTRTATGWEIQPKESMGHGGIAPPPSAEDPNLPPGHPPTSGEAPQQNLPQGHPPVQQ